MIAYLDTSGYVPLLVAEPSTSFCQELWNAADSVVTSRLLYVETAAALAQGARLGRLTEAQHADALQLHTRMWREFDVVEADDRVAERAATLAFQLALRGYDAVHAASAEELDDPDLVFVSGDRKLLDACSKLGLTTADTNAPQ